MDWQTGMILVVVAACIVPGIVALLAPRKPKPRRFVQRDVVAHRHRAIARSGFKSRMGVR